MTFFGNCRHDWAYLKKLARETGDWELYNFADRMEKEEKKWEPKLPGE